MTRQGELNVLRGAGIQDVEENALAFLNSDGIAIAQRFAVDGESLITDLPTVGFGLLLLGFFLFALELRVALFFHLLGAEKGFEFMGGEEDFLVVPARIVFRLDVYKRKLAGVGTAVGIGHRHHV